jgi:hypothetical protein
MFHGPALPRVSKSAIRRTHPSWLRRGRSGLPLSTIHGPWHGLVRGQRDDTLQPHGAVVKFVIDSEPDTDIELIAHMALTSLCEDHLTATTALPIALLLIRNQENLIW